MMHWNGLHESSWAFPTWQHGVFKIFLVSLQPHHGHQCRSPNDITCITQMSVLSLCVVHEGGKTSSASPWALVTGSLRLTRLAGTFAGCKRKLLLLNWNHLQTNLWAIRTVSNSVSLVVGFSEDQKGGKEKPLSLSCGNTVVSPHSKSNWKAVLTDSGFCQEQKKCSHTAQ